MTLNHIQRIFKEKSTAKFKDKYGLGEFTVAELNEAFLKPIILMHSDGKIPQGDIDFFERFEKV